MNSWRMNGQRLAGGAADVLGVDGHVAPAQDDLALDPHVELQQLLELSAAGRVVRQEADADAVAAGLGQLEVHDRAEEPVRELGEDPRAVARSDVRALGAAVLEVVQRGERSDDGLVVGLVVQPGDHGDAAGVVLICRVVQAFGLGQRTIGHVVSRGGPGAREKGLEG